MEIKVNVTVDFSEGAERLLRELAGRLVREPAAKAQQGDDIANIANIAKVAEGAKEPEGASDPEPEAEGGEMTYPTNEDMRRSMDNVITKLAGAGWSEKRDSRTLAIKKGCTKAFKEITKWLGAEKPTQLEGEKRFELIKQLDKIVLEEKEGGLPEVIFRPF